MIQQIIHQDTDGWWFWKETWAVRHGPFQTEKEAELALDTYCQEEGLSIPYSYVFGVLKCGKTT